MTGRRVKAIVSLRSSERGMSLDNSLERVAVLVDCESSIKWPGRPMDLLMLEIAQWGNAIVRRAYGEIRSDQWRKSLAEHAFCPIPEFGSRSGSKTAMIIDAMDLLFDRDIDVFVFVSSSSQLSRLAMRIRESNRVIICYGDRSASRDLVNACHRFVYLDNLGLDLRNVPPEICQVEEDDNDNKQILTTSKEQKHDQVNDQNLSSTTARTRTKDSSSRCFVSGPELRSNKLLVEMLTKAVRDNTPDTADWALLSTVGHELLRIMPDFDARDFGYNKLGDLLRASELFEFRKSGPDNRIVHIRALDPFPFDDDNIILTENKAEEEKEEPRRALV
eukprot:CAMPEP_0197309546 /NCGR_PEP_ID=MMETSP0891-20130614/8118_1 /TAXON_ID=44058 ORGANISM="Aureoumbra lagunensis, Strain CCMP1510" /NCGR_SAMPLE_ID=MMETSP0891 /ASSEMBLY_ACC=CAM_ASM_000534 /LENGTH=332 /DNA_ID=CAMNT_0042794667 /DNA_START=144 /DNA_END=1142 /DNA_ORIENTATION=+